MSETMNGINIDECMNSALELVLVCGDVIRKAIYSKKKIETKQSDADLVTETDKAVEKRLIGELKKKYPQHNFIGEESVSGGEKCQLKNTPTWIIDPVDGTLNFVHSFPNVCISVALAVNKEVVLGIVYAPIFNQLFTAKQGQGAFLNGEKITASKQDELIKALVVFEVLNDRTRDKQKQVCTNFCNLVPKTHNLRSVGSAALSMCYVAAGWADAYYDYGIHCWDMAAGCILVREAGGVVIDPQGGPFEIMSRRLICSSTLKLAKILSGELQHYDFDMEG